MKKLSNIVNALQRIIESSRARKVILGLFVVQALVLVFVTHFGVPPDENNHIEFIQYYAKHSPTPFFTDQEPTWFLGDKTREVDYIYHYVMSWVLRILPLSDSAELYIVRMFSVAFALVTFLLLVRLWHNLGLGNATINIMLLTVTNLPMVLMLSSAVNNDVLVWLAVIASTLLLIKLWQDQKAKYALLLLLISVYGGLTKRTLLPVAFVVGLITLVTVINKWPVIRSKIKWPDWRLITAGALLLVGVGLFVERVGGNIYQYGTVTPTCEEVQGEEACKVFWSSVRKEWLNDATNTSTTGWLAGGAVKQDDLIPLPVFAVRWGIESLNNIVDIQTQGWKHSVTPPSWYGAAFWGFIVAGILVGFMSDIKTIRSNRQARLRLFVMVLMVTIITSHLVVNFMYYQTYHVFGLALNGRYILPAIIPLTGLSFYFIGKKINRPWRVAMALLLPLSIITGSGLVMILRNSQLFTG